MKKIYTILLLSICFIFQASQAENLKILVSINPLYSLVKNLTNGINETNLLVTPNASPHNYQLKPSDIMKIREADIIIIIDDEFEVFLSKYLSKNKLKAKIVKIIELPSLITLPARNIKVLDLDHAEEEHEAGHTHETGCSHESGHSHSHSHHHIYNIDMHVWTDILNAQIIVQEISSILAELDKENAVHYYANAKKTKKKLQELDIEITNILDKNIQMKPFIVFHDAYQYLEKRYNLQNAGSVAGNNFIYGPKTLKQLKTNIEKYKIKCIFAEPQFSDTLVKKIAKNTGININYLDIEGGTFGFNMKPEEIYFFIMRKNAQNIRDCISSD
jgi:zinc transport system substrate-binding protein